MRLDAMILVFWMLSFKPTFSLSSFTFIKMLFSSSLLSAIMVVSSAYLRLLIFLPSILIPDCASSRPAFLMMYSAYKLNKQGDNIQPWHTPFLIWNQSVCSISSSNCCFLTYIQLSQEAGQVVWFSHLLKNFPQCVVVHTVKGFGIVSKAEVDVFLELSCFFDDSRDIGNLISGCSAFFKSSLNICGRGGFDPWIGKTPKDIIWYLSFSFWRTLLCMIIGGSIHVAAGGIISFFSMAECYSITYIME